MLLACLSAFIVTSCFAKSIENQNSQTESQTATKIFTPSQTSESLTASTPLLLPSSTIRSTLSPEEMKIKIIESLQQNSNCMLPCLWGVSPVKTDLSEFQDFLSQFHEDRTVKDYEIGVSDFGKYGGVSLVYQINDVYIIAKFGYRKNKEETKLELLTMNAYAMESLGIDQNNQLPILAPIWGNMTFNKELKSYTLSTILSNYGKPDQILISVLPEELGRSDIKWHPFSIILVYSQAGVFIEYIAPLKIEEDNFIVCSNEFHFNIVVWDVAQNLTLDYIFEQGSIEATQSNSKPIEDVTSYTVDEFYEIFSQPNEIICLDTSQKFWTNP